MPLATANLGGKSVHPENGTSPTRLSPGALVTVTREGLRINGRSRAADEPKSVELDLGCLKALAALSANGDRTDAPNGALMDALREMGLLVEARSATRHERIACHGPKPAARLDPSRSYLLAAPRLVRVQQGQFELIDFDGDSTLRLTSDEVLALPNFTVPRTIDEAITQYRSGNAKDGLDSSELRALAEKLVAAGFMATVTRHHEEDRTREVYRQALHSHDALAKVVGGRLESARRKRTTEGPQRMPVLPVLSSPWTLPLGLGMVLSAIRGIGGPSVEDNFDVRPHWLIRREQIARACARTGVFLFSNYVWDHESNLTFSKEIKQRNPACLTVHGGPDTPKYEHDCEAYFAANPHVDIAIHGEGEVTACEALAALAPQVERSRAHPQSPFDLEALAEVPGLSFRLGDRVVHTAPRARIQDPNQIPSPFDGDLFTDLVDTQAVRFAIIETNRGCPYGCTFCDWGGGTASKVRQFPLDRVFRELEWCARNKIPRLTFADANFGMFSRDVEIAEKISELKRRYGYPQWFASNYAKNTVKHIREIVSIMLEAGIHTEGLLSLQSTDPDTLDAIHRSNIKTEHYERMAREFRDRGMPLFVDLMVGLPGQTPRSFRADLQYCIDREVTAKVFPTDMLVNSPMNEPSYRTHHRIETAPAPNGDRSHTLQQARVVSTASFDRDDYEQMLVLRRAFLLLENYGVMRQITRFVRSERGVREIDFIDQLVTDAASNRAELPILHHTLTVMPDLMVPPGSWALFVDETGRYLVDDVGLADDTALRTVLDVQHALLPDRDRNFPCAIEIAHDFAAWHSDMMAAKDAGHLDDWHRTVPRLRNYPPATFVVDDAKQLCRRNFGFSVDESSYNDWELDSPVRRPMPSEHAIDV